MSAMARVHFTENLRRHIDCPPRDAGGATLREVLDAAFIDSPALRGYILDEQGRLRQHIVVFIDGEASLDRVMLSDPLGPDAQVYVMQALSGG